MENKSKKLMSSYIWPDWSLCTPNGWWSSSNIWLPVKVKIIAFAIQDEENKSDEEEEDLYYPPDSDGNIFDIFDNDEAL